MTNLADELERRLQLAKDHGPLSDNREVYIPSSWLPALLASLTGEGEPVAQDAKDAEITRLRADITALEDGNMTWMCDQLDKAKAENTRMREALGIIAEGSAPPIPHGHYLAHRRAVDVARVALSVKAG